MHGRDRVALARALAYVGASVVTTALAGAWVVFASANGLTWSSIALLATALVLPAVLVATRAARGSSSRSSPAITS